MMSLIFALGAASGWIGATMTEKNLQEEISPTIKEIIEKCRGSDEFESFAFFGSVALELWAINLQILDEEDGNKLLDHFTSEVKKRSQELKEIAKAPKWHQ